MNYEEKLRDPRWLVKRTEMIELAGGKCEDCGAEGKKMNVHHCIYIKGREPWEYEKELLICLCEDGCHMFRQGREQALHIVLALVLRCVPIAELEEKVWDALHDAIKDAAGMKAEFITDSFPVNERKKQ